MFLRTLTYERRAALFCAVLCTAAVALWQYAAVHFNYGDDPSALFYTRAGAPLPPFAAAENIRTADASGYDGQFYHLVAHDPLLLRDTARFVDNPRLRWRRILLPGAANLVALGRDEYVDSAYFGLVLACVFAGAYWTARFTRASGLSAWWGLAFAFVPAVLVSIDRMTTDVALAALCAAFALYAAAIPSERGLFAALTLAPLARETGFVLLAGWLFYLLLRREFRRAACYAAAAVPGVLWTVYIFLRTAPDQTVWTTLVPFAGVVHRTLHPVVFPITTPWLRKAAALEYVAVLGIWAALAIALYLLLKNRSGPLQCAIFSFAALAALLAKEDIWSNAYSFARTQTPLLFLTALWGLRQRVQAALLPWGLVLPRILYQFVPQLKGVLHGLLH